MKQNEPAFPHNEESGDGEFIYHPGMTMRQWYKGMALTHCSATIREDGIVSSEIPMMVKYCGVIADALLAEDAEFEAREK
jgi:hypothetical protein